MNPVQYSLFLALADGRVTSAKALAVKLGITRQDMERELIGLRSMGLDIRAGPDAGISLAWKIEPLDRKKILAALGKSGISVEVLAGVDSTSTRLGARTDIHRHAVLAEYQSSGRGRRGRHWNSPPGAGIYLSFGYRFDRDLGALGPLGLVAGVAACEAVEQETGAALRLKWPNDLVATGDRKLGGCLVEVQGAAGAASNALIGVGINIRLPAAGAPDQDWTDLWAERRFEARNRLGATLIQALDHACDRFWREGFDPFRDRWSVRDSLAGRCVRVMHGDGRSSEGVAGGISRRGGLYLLDGRRRTELQAGEVSVRVC